MHVIGNYNYYKIQQTCVEIDGLQLKAISIATDDIRLSDADRRSYEKVFSSILVPYTALTVGEEIGQGG